MDVMTFGDFVNRHKVVEQWVSVVSRRGRWLSVP
jgi:hypothetical protein